MNNLEEKVVAVVDPLTSAGEEELATQVTDLEVRAQKLTVSDDQQYEEAGQIGTLIKQRMSEVTDFFAPMKKAAHEAHKQICDREKKMLAPLKKAEAALKDAMGEYVMRQEEERRAAEEEARHLAQAEADRKLEEAIQAEQDGDEEALRAAMIDAEIADSASRSVFVDGGAPKTKGVSYQQDWEITAIDASKVPTEINGAIIRPVDTGAVMKLIRASKGTIQIEGITYKEKAKMSFRRA